ncbi:MAG TPA: hypothetical protein VEL76_23925 [Gemmataceae bacterium]|nr:hypothetical protein [Gemmataceae bacterium]
MLPSKKFVILVVGVLVGLGAIPDASLRAQKEKAPAPAAKNGKDPAGASGPVVPVDR